MNQIKFVHDVIDWKTFAQNFEQQHSNASIMIFKSEERSYVQNLLQEKQPKIYEYEKYLDYALRFHLQNFEIDEHLYQRKYVQKVNVVFILATDIREYKKNCQYIDGNNAKFFWNKFHVWFTNL